MNAHKLIILFALLSMGCNNTANNISEIMGAVISFPTELSPTFNGRDTTKMELPPIKLLLYKDSTNCSLCSATSLTDYGYIIDYAKNGNKFALIFIYDVTKNSSFDLLYGLEKYPIDYPVFLDKKGEFAQKNMKVLMKSNYHAFLLDAQNQIVLVGDPVHNSQLWELYKTVIQKMIDNNGILISE